MFSSAAPNPLDLRWRMFGISVRIKFTFWVVWILIGLIVTNPQWFARQWTLRLDWPKLIPFVVVTFASFFLHELAHVVVGRIFGVRGGFVLGAFGGALTGEYERLRRWQRILVYAAGPALNFGLWAAADAYRVHGNPNAWGGNAFRVIWFSILQAKDLNFFWACINLLPIYPLDGGMIARDLCETVSRRYGLIISLIISLLLAGSMAAYSLYAAMHPEVWHWGWRELSFAFDLILAMQSFSLLMQALRERRPQAKAPDQPHVETAPVEEEYVHDWDKRDQKSERSRTFP